MKHSSGGLGAGESACVREHTPILRERTGSAYVTDEGQEVPAHALYRYECSCGWKGLCWYAGQERARAHFDRHDPISQIVASLDSVRNPD